MVWTVGIHSQLSYSLFTHRTNAWEWAKTPSSRRTASSFIVSVCKELLGFDPFVQLSRTLCKFSREKPTCHKLA